ncbi:Hypothetical predicted protein [Mytilus galloprovincialis]|uniref:Uncharacterized protein n=1 Tax=Mytilus galloprovincialis TaxID=29158 RepID=A0A8B6G0I1_MYTGA|nr:Hypothetical predicted protein [Mytilus galloprovincialis]
MKNLKYELSLSSKLIDALHKTSKPVYIAREKKLSKISGRPTKETDPLISDWTEDATEHLSTFSDEKARVEFLMDHVTGPAKDELRVRPKRERDSADKMLKLIHIIYDDVDSIIDTHNQVFQIDSHKSSFSDRQSQSSFSDRQSQSSFSDRQSKPSFSDRSERKCFNFGGKGHIKVNCPSPKFTNTNDSNSSRGKQTYRGQSRGYSSQRGASLCNVQNSEEIESLPKDTLPGKSWPMGVKSVDSVTFSTEIFNNVTGKCPEIDILIENQPVRSLIDTGSQVSTISETFFNSLLEKKPVLYDITKWMKVTGANDLPIPYVGYIEVDINIINTCIPKVGMLVVKDSEVRIHSRKSKTQSLLGSINFFRKVKDTVDLHSENKQIEMIGKQLFSILTLYNISAENDTENIDSNEKVALSFVKIVGKSPVLIPANSMRIVSCTTRQQ